MDKRLGVTIVAILFIFYAAARLARFSIADGRDPDVRLLGSGVIVGVVGVLIVMYGRRQRDD